MLWHRRQSLLLSCRRITAFVVSSLFFTSCAFTEDVTMAFGASLPPYVIPQGAGGMEVDIIREALAESGHTLIPQFFPLKRALALFEHGETDAIHRRWGEVSRHHYVGDPSINYLAVIISLKSANLLVTKPGDLDGLSLAAFVGAKSIYASWIQPTERFKRYLEVDDQELQVKMLHRKRVSAILLDINIYRYLLAQLKAKGVNGFEETNIFRFANEVAYSPVFRDAKIRDDYNVGISKVRQKARDKEIIEGYLQDVP